jgi:peroxiredoxin
VLKTGSGKGVDKIAVLAVNDFFTVKAWGKDLKVRPPLKY